MFPHVKGTTPFWRLTPQELDNYSSTPDLPTESDIVIIGGGFSAAALVTHIQQQYENKKNISVLVLEARQLCSGASGRNGGHIKPDPYSHASAIAAEHGNAAAAEVANFEAANLQAVKEYVKRENVDCDFVVTRACDVYFSAKQDAKAKEDLRSLRKAGVAAAREASEVGEKYAEIVSGVKGAKGCVTFTAAHLWPYKLIHHMFVQALQHGGLNLQTNTRATSISSDGLGRWFVQTDRGVVHAGKVVVASNSYTAALLPEYRDQIIPHRGVSCHIVAADPAPLLVNTYALKFNDWDFDYLIPRIDGTIVVGGARSAYFRSKDQWYGNVNDSEVTDELRKYFEGYMQRHFRGWEKSGAKLQEIWTGIMGYSRDKLPRVGAVPGRDGVFIMGGWTGHGMPQIFLAAKGLGAMIVEDVPYSQTGLPRVFEETADRLRNAPNKVLESWHQATQGPRL